MIVLVVECPTPYNTPILNRLYQELDEEMCVFYLYSADTLRGWGPVKITTPCAFLDQAGGWTALAKSLLSPRLRAVCTFGYRGAARIIAANLARLRGVPLVLRGTANVRSELPRPPLRRFAKRWYLRALLGCPEVWTNGSANRAYWRLVGLQKHHHEIPNVLQYLPGNSSGAAALRERLEITDRFVFTYVGRLEQHKGVTDLLQAYDIVRAGTPGGATALVIAGRGPLEPEVRRYIEAHDDCHYLGAVPQDRLGAVYAAADIFINPSHGETWGWVVNEALGFGTRVIASVAVAAADDLCTDESGRRCPVADPPGLAAAMLAEYREGPRQAATLECADTGRIMADRMRELVRPAARAVRT